MSKKIKPDPNDRLYNMKDLHSWCEEALPGEEYVYWTGHLGRDRFDDANPERRKLADSMAKAAMDLYENKKVALIQRRTTKKSKWDYVAVKLLPRHNRWVREASTAHTRP